MSRRLSTNDPSEALAWALKRLQGDPRADMSDIGITSQTIHWCNRMHPEFKLEPVDYWNPADNMPPPHIPLVILVDGRPQPCRRERYEMTKDADMEFVAPDGVRFVGRYKWRYA